MRLLLDLAYVLAAPFVLLALAWPSRLFTRKRYRAGLREKLGFVTPRPGARRCVWIHAVSVGEVRTSVPLVLALRERLPDWDLVLSTSTDTGYETASRALGEGAGDVRLVYFPLDLSWAVGRSLDALRPDAVVLVELELWPNFLLACRRRGIPALVANGRLTARSCARYGRAGRLARFLFSLPVAYAAQNETYAERFESLGVPQERISVLGNLKYDAPAGDAGDPGATRAALGWVGESSGPVVMGGCTHPGEEVALLDAAAALLERHADLRLVLAPRHIERAPEVFELASRRRLGGVARWSDVELGAAAPRNDGPPRVLVVDRIGVLERFYSIADVAFVGGSLIERGGHNMLEPARQGAAVLVGPSVFNFEDVAGHLTAREATLTVGDAGDLLRALEALLAEPKRRRELGERARSASAELAGAVAAHVEWLLGSFDAAARGADA